MLNTTSKKERMEKNRQVYDFAWLAQEAIIRIHQGGCSQTATAKLAGVAKEALLRLRPLTGETYQIAVDDLCRLEQRHQARGTTWTETINQMEDLLQWLDNAPMARRAV